MVAMRSAGVEMAIHSNDLSLRLAIVATGLTTAAMVIGAVGAHSITGRTIYAAIAGFAFLTMAFAITVFVKGRSKDRRNQGQP